MNVPSLKVDCSTSFCTTPTERPDQIAPIKVGCLHINPASTRGRQQYMLQMLFLCFLPHAALVIQNCTIMAQLSYTLDSSMYLNSELTTVLTVGEALMAIQDERYIIAAYLFQSSQSPGTDLGTIKEVISSTNERCNDLPPELFTNDHRKAFYQLREDLLNNKYSERKSSYKRLAAYDDVIADGILYFDEYIKSVISPLWRQLSACYELLRAREKLYQALYSVQYLTTFDELDEKTVALFSNHEERGKEYFQSLIRYLIAEKLQTEELENCLQFYKSSNLFTEVELQRINMISYEKESKICLDALRRYQYGLRNVVRETAQREVWQARRTLFVGVAILIVVLIASPVLIMLIKNTINTMQGFIASIETTTQRLMAEKQKSDLLLSRMLPLPVLNRLRAQRTVPAEAFDAVTIFFSDIVGFTNIAANSTPMEVINMLNMLYRLFDEKIMQYNIYKVETIGDAYMAVSGLPQRNGNRHASEIADMSLSLMRSLEGAKVPHCPEDPLRIRVGVNTGPCVAGVVGTTMPRYCLFGDTINTASRMESTGEAMKIHISESTKQALDLIGGYKTKSRGLVGIQGKGDMETFWLVGKVGGIPSDSPCGLKLEDYDHNILEMLIRA